MSERVVLQQEPAAAPEAKALRGDGSGGSLEAGLEPLFAALGRVRRLCPTLAVAAIHWMTVKHPIQPIQERLMREAEDGSSKAGAIGPAGLWLRALRCVGYAACLSAILIWLRWRLRRERSAMRRERFDLIGTSWWFEADPHRVSRDFYYGDMPQRLQRLGLRMLVLLADGVGVSLNPRQWDKLIRSCEASPGLRRLPALASVPMLAPLRMAADQLRSSLRLRRVAARAEDGWVKRVSLAASAECLARQTTDNGLLFWVARGAVSHWKPRAFMALYEGNSWERCAWLGVRACGIAGCRTIGYQHTVLLRHNLSLLRPLPSGPMEARPDAVLCIGERTAAMLLASHPASGLVSFGTFRRDHREPALRTPEPAKRTVLVLPEGYIEEEKRLFEAAMAAAERLPDHRFIFRCHPVAPYEWVRPQLARSPEALHNVEISIGRSIAADFERASALLYRGSSSALHAVLQSLKPIYWDAAGCWDVDPLFELAGWRERASGVDELVEALERYGRTDPADATLSWRAAFDYADTYSLPVTEESIEQLLEAGGFDGQRRGKLGTGSH